MKLKCDFVTNSSSSSFIVAWPTKIKKYEDVKKFIMFTEQAEVVFDDSKRKKSDIKEGLIQGLVIDSSERVLNMVTEEIARGYFDGYLSPFDEDKYKELYSLDLKIEENRKKWNELFNELEQKNKMSAKEIAKKFVSKNQGKFLYFFSYADEDGEFYSKMEHGDIFNKLDYLRISHH